MKNRERQWERMTGKALFERYGPADYDYFAPTGVKLDPAKAINMRVKYLVTGGNREASVKFRDTDFRPCFTIQFKPF